MLSVFLLALTASASARGLSNSNKSSSSAESELGPVLGINPSSITSQSQLESVPSSYWQHVIDDLPNELPFVKLWTGGWCPLAYGNPAPLGPDDTSATACVKCSGDGTCAICDPFYTCKFCIPGYSLNDQGECAKLVY